MQPGTGGLVRLSRVIGGSRGREVGTRAWVERLGREDQVDTGVLVGGARWTCVLAVVRCDMSVGADFGESVLRLRGTIEGFSKRRLVSTKSRETDSSHIFSSLPTSRRLQPPLDYTTPAPTHSRLHDHHGPNDLKTAPYSLLHLRSHPLVHVVTVRELCSQASSPLASDYAPTA